MENNLGFVAMSGRINPQDNCYECGDKKQVYLKTNEQVYLCKNCFDKTVAKKMDISLKKYTNKDLMCMSDSMGELARFLKERNFKIFGRNDITHIFRMLLMNNTELSRVVLTVTPTQDITLTLKDSYGETRSFVLLRVYKNNADIATILYYMLKGKGL